MRFSYINRIACQGGFSKGRRLSATRPDTRKSRWVAQRASGQAAVRNDYDVRQSRRGAAWSGPVRPGQGERAIEAGKKCGRRGFGPD
jgi:hypothetical protein